jgi:hypothetical protein
MPVHHRVSQGECLASIACTYGLHCRTIYNDHLNAELRIVIHRRLILSFLYSPALFVRHDNRAVIEIPVTESVQPLKQLPVNLR